jgi:metal-responsive CopG/Arc/MetJ family transcriptional regulator
MTMVTIQKVTVSLPRDLVIFADTKASERGITRSRLVAELLADFKMRQEDALAAEGYQFYAQEAREFAEASGQAVAEALSHDG